MLACITVAGWLDEKHVKKVNKRIFSLMTDKQVIPSSNNIKIHCMELEVSTKFPVKHDTWHSWLHGLVKSFSKGRMEKSSGQLDRMGSATLAVIPDHLGGLFQSK